MSAALATGKPARSAPKAAYSIVVSSETRKVATLATQNTGQGDAGRARGSAAAGVAEATARVASCMVAQVSSRSARGSGGLRQIARRRRREALLDEPGAFVGEHLVLSGLEAVERTGDDLFGARLRTVDGAHEIGVDER